MFAKILDNKPIFASACLLFVLVYSFGRHFIIIEGIANLHYYEAEHEKENTHSGTRLTAMEKAPQLKPTCLHRVPSDDIQHFAYLR